MNTLKVWAEGIRKEFQEFADSIIWSNDAGDEKYIGVGNMADWWIDKYTSLHLKEIEEEIKELEGIPVKFPQFESDEYDRGYSDALSLIISKKKAEAEGLREIIK